MFSLLPKLSVLSAALAIAIASSSCAVILRNSETGSASNGSNSQSSSSASKAIPTISTIANVAATTGLAFGVSFSITGANCSADYLTLVSDDGALIQDSSVAFSGTESVCTATVTPEDGPEGLANLNIILRNSAGQTSQAFAVNLSFPDGFTVFPHQLGTHAFNSVGQEGVNAMEIDSAGNLYIAGQSDGSFGEVGGSNDAFVAKFDSGGTLQWIKQLGETTIGGTADDGSETVYALAIDSSGNLYIAGATTGSLGETNGGGNDIFAAKFNSSGTLQWVRQLGEVTLPGAGNDGGDYAHAIAVNSSGEVFLTGYTTGSLGETNGGSGDVFVAKYSASGVFQWVKQLGATTIGGTADDGDDRAYGIKLNGSGEIFLAASTSGALGETNGGSRDVMVIKLNSSGALQWIKQLGEVTMPGAANNGLDDVGGLAMDGSGNLFIAGRTSGALGETSGGNYDIFIAKFNTSGTLQWIKQLGEVTLPGTANDGVDQAWALTLDGSGNIIVCGKSQGNLGETKSGSSNSVVAKFDSSGNFLWVRQLGSVTLPAASHQWHSADGVVADASGNIYFTGDTGGSLGELNSGQGTYDDAFIVKYNSTGVFQWVKQLGSVTMPTGTADQNDYLMASAIDDDQNSIVTGYTDGSLGETNGGSNDAIVAKFSSAGSLQWVRQLGNTTIGGTSDDGNDQSNAVAVDSSGDVFIAGRTSGSLGETNGGSNDVFVAKYSSAGVFQWVKQLGNTTVGGTADDGSDIAYSIALDSSGNIFVTGSTSGSLGETNGGSTDVFVVKLNSAGAPQWIRQMGGTTIGGTADDGADVPRAIAVDSVGDVFVTGYTAGSLGEANGGSNDIFLAKYSSAGVFQWVKQLGGVTVGGASDDGDDRAFGMVLDNSNNIFVTGRTGALGETNGGAADVVLIKYNSSGVPQWIRQMGDVTIGGVAVDGTEIGNSIAMDVDGALFIGGNTDGSLGETTGGSNDVFIAKYSAAGVFQWVKQMGSVTKSGISGGWDVANAITVDTNGNVYGVGYSDANLSGTNLDGNDDGLVFRWSP